MASIRCNRPTHSGRLCSKDGRFGDPPVCAHHHTWGEGGRPSTRPKPKMKLGRCVAWGVKFDERCRREADEALANGDIVCVIHLNGYEVRNEDGERRMMTAEDIKRLGREAMKQMELDFDKRKKREDEKKEREGK